MKRLFRYFINGFLIIAPITITVYIVVAIIDWLNDMFDLEIPGVGRIPGLGILLMIVLLTIIGYIGSSFFVRPLFLLAERLLVRVPLINIIYTSLKDLFDAFVGDNQKFNKPVLVKMSEQSQNLKMGFVTQDTLLTLNLPDKVAVYFPHSYNFSGELFMVPKENVTFLDLPSSEVMKFVVSGGVSRL
ncbi:MAG: DUF502 domain-containing protein [Hymenobacteraceae bacterium]|nr:DUF502 domain-containing protein [Hymenobacteraceae bacterium]MDX5396175.1 DUF502 domain-containing protein [Hymenobacteraceae bacterium]MDX5512236.1 DUF502 domain-containing protein [Hymenobacteraceae bacterium]